MKLVIKKKAKISGKKIENAWVWECRLREAKMSGEPAVKRLVLEQWDAWGLGIIPEKTGLVLLETKVAYVIDMHQRKVEKFPITERFLRNHKAAMRLDLQGFDPDMKRVLGINIEHRSQSPEQEEAMKVKRKAAAEKAQVTKAKNNPSKGPKKGATWFGLFKANHSAKLTDAALAKAMTKAMGDGHTYTEQEVVKNRGFYNFGGFGKNYPKPKAALEQFKDEKTAAKSKKK